MSTKPFKVLVAPLDWGLGHTTRCIPIINELLRQGCEVFAAGNNTQRRIIMEEFREIPFLELEGYDIKYGRSAWSTGLKIVWQIPKILRAIRREQAWLKEKIATFHFDAVISDNRYGLFLRSAVPSVFITHQLGIKSSFGKQVDRVIQSIHISRIRKFTECWVPDYHGPENIAGDLSYIQRHRSLDIKYLGPLSRLKKDAGLVVKNKLLVILSGPEPQRSILENRMIDELARSGFTATVVRGLPGFQNMIPSTNHIHFFNHLPAATLNKEMNEAEYIVSRCGYSTVMDTLLLGKRAIFIPTPGQTEQQYLASYLNRRKYALCIGQERFSLQQAIEQARSFPFHFLQNGKNEVLLKEAVTGLIARYHH